MTLELARTSRSAKVVLMCNQAKQANESGGNLWSTLAPLRRGAGSKQPFDVPTPALLDKDSSALDTLPAIKERWVSHFAEVECKFLPLPLELLTASFLQKPPELGFRTTGTSLACSLLEASAMLLPVQNLDPPMVPMARVLEFTTLSRHPHGHRDRYTRLLSSRRAR